MSPLPKFQVKYGQWSTDFIIVDADELEKLQYAIKKNAFFVGKYGDVDTSKIVAIRPDFKETYGAAPDYELVGEDYDEIMAAHGDIRLLVSKAEERVRFLIEQKQEHLIGKGTAIPQLEKPQVERGAGLTAIKDLLPTKQ